MTYNADASSLDLTSLSVFAHIRLHRRTLYELEERGIVRTLNQLQGDWAERLVKDAYGGVLAPPKREGIRRVLANGERLQVKSRAIDHRNMRSGEVTSAFRSWEFDKIVIVLLDPKDLSAGRAAELTRHVVRENKIERGHVNGFVLTPNDALMSQGRVATTYAPQMSGTIDRFIGAGLRKTLVRWENTKLGRSGFRCPYRGVHFVW